MNKKLGRPELLRIEAEAHPADLTLARTANELLRELRAHKIELEIQNKILRQSLSILNESRDHYIDFYDSAPTGYVSLNCDALITDINVTGATLLGKKRDKLVGSRFSSFVAPEDKDLWHQHFMAMQQHDDKLACELKIRRRDGSHLYVQLDSMRLLKDGKPTAVRISLTDISERRRLEEELRKSEKRMEFALDGAGDGVWDWNPRTDEAQFSRRWKEMIGYGEHEFPDTGAAWVEHLHPEDRERVLTAVHEYFEGKRPHYAVEFRLRCKDGSWEWILARGKLIDCDAEGKPLRMIGTHTNISERKQMEQLLQESKTHYQQMFDEAAFIAFLLDPESGNIVDANAAASTFWGYTREELRGMHVSRINTAPCEEIHAVMERFKDKRIYRYEWRHKLKNGEIRDVEVCCGPLVTRGRTMLYSVLHDITEQKLAEAALHESETHLRILEQREIVQTSLDGFWVVSTADSRILDVNDAFCNMVGYSREELLSMCISDLEADESPVATAAHVKKIMAVGYDRFETRHRHKRGQMVNVEISVSHSELDGGILFVFSRDITERIQAENKLRESENRFRTLFESATDCILMLDCKGRIVDINSTGYERLGYEKHEMLGRQISEFDTPEFAAIVPDRLASIQKKGKAIFEAAHVRKNGTVMPIEINTKIIHLDGEQRYFSVIRDITERKRAEQHMRELSAHLNTVREEEKARFAREIHDDLGSTLSAIRIEAHQLNCGLSSEQRATPLFARVESMVGLLDDALASTRRIITDLRPSLLDDLGLIAALEWQAEQFHKRTGIECHVDCTNKKANDCKVCTDCEYTTDRTLSINLFRIFQEALANVARHSGASRVEVEFQPRDDEVILSICDNGCGLPETHTVAPTSFGIRGMHERAEQLGGKINLVNQPGGGLSVIVGLPLPVDNQIEA